MIKGTNNALDIHNAGICSAFDSCREYIASFEGVG